MPNLIALTGALLATTALVHAQNTNWVAFNDYRPTVGVTAPNVAPYDLRVTGDGGPLTNYFTGEQLAAAVTVVSIGAPDDFGANNYPNAGSPSYNLFNGIIDLGNSGLPGLRAGGAAGITLTFTNLDPSQRYIFRGTVSRGNNYFNRWAIFSLQNALAFTDAHVNGSANTNIFTADTYAPAAGVLSNGQVVLNSGENRDGSLVGWNEIQPDENGTFSIYGERYLGPTPYGNAADPGTSYAYGLNAILLAEVSTGPPQAPAITVQPVDVSVSERETAVLKATAVGTGPLRFQWYRGTPPNGTPIGGATRSSFAVVNTTGSGQTWSVPADSGQYYAVISGAVAPPVTTRVATVTVTADTTAPRLLFALPTTNMNEFELALSEPLVNDGDYAGTVTDGLNWNILGQGVLDLGILAISYAAGSTNVYFTTTDRDPAGAYRIVLTQPLYDAALAHNELPAGSSVGVNSIENELLALNATWRYSDNDVDPGPTWAQPAYADSGTDWRSGPGPFDAKRRAAATDPSDCRVTTLYGLGDVGTCINLTSPITQTNLIAAYFRTHFNFSGNPATTILRLNGKLDDGGVLYLNGVELSRIGMASPPALIDHVTFSTRSVGDTDAQDVESFFYPAALRTGDNVLAVSLHEANLTSSDLTMGLRLVALMQTPMVAAPVLRISYANPNVTIHWTPATGALQFLDELGGTWQDVSPAPAAGGPYTVAASAVHRFYRVRP